MPAPNPWSLVPAAEYEEYMGPRGTGEAAPLATVLGKIVRGLRPARIAVPGCGTGGGLEHVDPGVTRRVVAVDLNVQYLAVARQRHLRLGAALELFCEDALRVRLEDGGFDLVHAALVLEHVDADALAARMARWLAPGGACSVVLALPGGAAPAPRGEALRQAIAAARPLAPRAAAAALAREGLVARSASELAAGAGRRLWVGLFTKPAAAPRAK